MVVYCDYTSGSSVHRSVAWVTMIYDDTGRLTAFMYCEVVTVWIFLNSMAHTDELYSHSRHVN